MITYDYTFLDGERRRRRHTYMHVRVVWRTRTRRYTRRQTRKRVSFSVPRRVYTCIRVWKWSWLFGRRRIRRLIKIVGTSRTVLTRHAADARRHDIIIIPGSLTEADVLRFDEKKDRSFLYSTRQIHDPSARTYELDTLPRRSARFK